MNKRILELAEQATASISYRVCQNTFKEIDDPAGPYVRKEFSKEKFAELIVKECIAQIQEQSPLKITNESHQKLVDAAYNSAVNISVAKIKQHFGVEE